MDDAIEKNEEIIAKVYEFLDAKYKIYSQMTFLEEEKMFKLYEKLLMYQKRMLDKYDSRRSDSKPTNTKGKKLNFRR